MTLKIFTEPLPISGLDARNSIPGKGKGLFIIFSIVSEASAGVRPVSIQRIPGVKRSELEADSSSFRVTARSSGNN
jgi:hypothetical protein